jgi:hypothetical protein
MNNESKNTDEWLKDIFKEMPLEKPSLNFMENLICRLEKEKIKEERKSLCITVLQWAVSVISLFFVPALAIYLCIIFIPDFTFSFSLTEIHINPVILQIGLSVLLGLIAEILLEKYIRDKMKKDGSD